MGLFILQIVVLGCALLFVSTNGQLVNVQQNCRRELKDMPDPSSDSCSAFFRCYRSRKYSVRCPLGKVFDFDRTTCRPADRVNCQLQLQRFQAPGVPGFMRPAQASEPREVEIRLVQVGTNQDPGANPVFLDSNGNRIPITRQFSQGQPAGSQPNTPPQNSNSNPAGGQSPLFGTGQTGQDNFGQGQNGQSAFAGQGGASFLVPGAAPATQPLQMRESDAKVEDSNKKTTTSL